MRNIASDMWAEGCGGNGGAEGESVSYVNLNEYEILAIIGWEGARLSELLQAMICRMETERSELNRFYSLHRVYIWTEPLADQ
jgi:hypothetical protein